MYESQYFNINFEGLRNYCYTEYIWKKINMKADHIGTLNAKKISAFRSRGAEKTSKNCPKMGIFEMYQFQTVFGRFLIGLS